MKKLVLLIAMCTLLFGSLLAEDLSEINEETAAELQIVKDELQIVKEELQIEFAGNDDIQKQIEAAQNKLEAAGETEYTVDVIVKDGKKTITINTPDKIGTEKPFIGVNYSDLTLGEAADLDYKYFYGIRLDNIEDDSPAYYFRLRAGDILMQINDNELSSQKVLGKVISYYRLGDKVNFKIFRDGEVMDVPFVFGSRSKIFDIDGNLIEDKSEKTDGITISERKNKKDYGDGTIAWIPSWYTPDVEDVNSLISNLGFEDKILSEDGYMLNTIAFKGDIGKGWFIGGQYSYYFDKNSRPYDWEVIDLDGQLDTLEVPLKVKFWSHFGGPTLERRFVFGKAIYSELGMMVAWGQQKLTVDKRIENSSDINWGETIEQSADGNYDYVSSQKLNNNFIMIEPRLSIGWRITDWLSLKAEAAYLYSYSTTGWEGMDNGDDVGVNDAPDTSMDGLRLSFGPWFGF